jgi:uncharacterized Zn finger protein
MQSIETMLAGLDRQELVDWADSTIYSRGKSYVDSVSELSRTEDGRLVAWVAGSDEYVTTVRRDGKGDFDYSCTCPYDYGGPCKHVVAVLLAAVEELKKKKEIPLLDPESDLYREASEYLDDDDDELDEEADEWYVSERKLDEMQKKIGSKFQSKSRDELLDILVVIIRDFPEVASWLHEREQVATGKIDSMVQALRKEIRDLTVIDVWSSDWEDDYDRADYTDVQERLQVLLEGGYADAVFDLGKELWERGNKQVAQSNDDGETALEIANCLRIVLKAIPDTSFSRREQLIWLFDSLRNDEYDLLDGADEVIDDPRYSTVDWHELALELEDLLRQMPLSEKDEWSRQYRRSKVVSQLREAYERAEENDKVLPLLEREAGPCCDYKPLVDYLIEAGDFDRARFWCIEGYGKMIEKTPGLASALKLRLQELAEKEGKNDLVAAYRALDFFQYPSAGTYGELRDAAERIALWPGVRRAAMDFLQNGKVPAAAEEHDSWLLPETEVGRLKNPERNRFMEFPALGVLIEIAILEERHDDVVALFKELCETRHCGREISEKVAESVRNSYPDTSLKIWRITVDNLIAEVKTHTYQEAARYLRKMHKVWQESDRLPEWRALISELRTKHKAKRNLMAVLNEVEQAVSPKA